MGRYIDRLGGQASPSPTPFAAPDGRGYNPPTQGRYSERLLGISVLGNSSMRGRYLNFKEEEQKFLESEEGQRMVQEILQQQEKMYQQTQEEVTQEASRVEERLKVADSVTRTERTMFGTGGTRRTPEVGQPLVDDLKALGWSQQEIDEQFRGVDLGLDIDAVQAWRAERDRVFQMNQDMVRDFGIAQSTNPVGFESATLREQFITAGTGLSEVIKATPGFVWRGFLEPRPIEAPFRSKRPEAIEARNDLLELTTWGGATAQFFYETLNYTVEGIAAFTQMLLAEGYFQSRAILTGEDPADMRIRPLYDISRFGLNEGNVGVESYDENVIRPFVQRSIETYMDLDKENPNRHLRNSSIVLWEQIGKPALDAWIGADIIRGMGRAAGTKLVREGGEMIVKQVKPGVFETVATNTLRRTPTDSVKLQTSYQVLGLNQGEIARLGSMSLEEGTTFIAQKMRERATAILRENFTPAPGAIPEGLTAQNSSKEVLDFLNQLKREGVLTPQQEIEILRLNLAVAQIFQLSDDAVVGIPRLMQIANEFAIMTSQPIRSLSEAEYAIQRALRLRARAAGESPIRPNIGLTIDDISAGGRGKKFVDEDVAKTIDPIAKKVAEDPAYAGIDIVFDSRNNIILITPESEQAWKALPAAATKAIIDLARENRVNLGQAYGWEEGVVPDINEFEGIVQGYNRLDLEIKRKMDETIRLKQEQMAQVDELDAQFLADGIPADDPMLQTLRQWSIERDMLIRVLDEIPQSATDRTVPRMISQQLLNTPIEAAQTIPPISRTGLDTTNPVGRAIINNAGDGFIARMADIARRNTTPQNFADTYGFLADARFTSANALRGDGLFVEVMTPQARIKDFLKDTLVREEIGKLIRTQIPLELVQMTPAWRRELLEEATEGMSAKAFERFLDPYSEGDIIRDQIYQRATALSVLTEGALRNPEEARFILENTLDKPNIPIFALTSEGQAVLLSQNRATQQMIAGAKYAGFDTIPAYIVDMKGAREAFKEFLKSEDMDLVDFAKSARKLGPAVKAKATSEALDARELRVRAGVLSGDLKVIGTSDENATVIPAKFLRRDFPIDQPVIFNGLLAREQWEISRLPIIGEGFSRVVFEIGPDAVLKVAKNEEGMVQSLMTYNTHALQQGLIPRLFAGGDNWIVTERHDKLAGDALRHYQDFIDQWRLFSMRQNETFSKQKLSLQRALEKKDLILSDSDYQIFSQSADMLILRKKLFEFINDWRQSPEAQTAFTRDGQPFYNWDEFARYDYNLDILKEDSWGVRRDGTLVLIDEGALYQEALAVTRGPHKTWREFIKNFHDTVKNSAEVKQKFKDYDPHRNFAFVPVPAIDGDDDEHGYQDDVLRSVLMSAFASTLGRGKMPKKRKANELDELRKQELPAPPARNPGAVKGALNSDPFRARTGEPFGGVFSVPRGVPYAGAGIKALDGNKNLAPLGDAQYTLISRDAADFLGNGKVDNVISHVDNPFIVRNNKDLEELARKAGVPDGNPLSIFEDQLQANIKLMRDYLEGRGHDGVIISMNTKLGQIDKVEGMFKQDQLINFSNKWQLATSPNTPKVTVSKTTRTKKLQRQIMRAIDPPKNVIQMEETRLLKLRLRTLNNAIKEGRQLGAAESRKFITARLRNSFGIYTNKMTRKHELQRLRDNILMREKQLIKQELVNYAKIKLPSKESREFLTERGKLIDSIAKLSTRTQMYKKMKQIEAMAERVERRLVTEEISKVVDRAISSPSVSADYRKLIKQFMSQYNKANQRPATRERITKMKEYIERQRALGEDIEITEGMLRQMEILSRTNFADLPVATLKNILDDLIILERIGRNKLRAENALFEAQKAKRAEAILNDLEPIEKTLKPMPEKPWLKLSPKQQLQDTVARFHDFAVRTGLAITPADTMVELMGNSRGRYESGVYRYLKEIHDQNYGQYLQDANLIRREYETLNAELKLGEENMVRIGIAMTRDQGQDAIERMVAMGIDLKDIEGIVLTEAENTMRLFFRQKLDAERPMLAKLARTIYNVEFNEVDNYFPMLADFARSRDLSIHERFGKSMPLFDSDRQILAMGRRTKVKADTLKKRVENAINPIKLNAAEVFFQHMDNTLYMKNMSRDVKMISEIVNSEEFALKGGELGTQFAKDYMDLLARKGGAYGADSNILIDTINRNVGVAILGLKLSTIVIQASAFAQGASLTGGKYMGQAMLDLMSRPDIRKFIHENMPEIRETYGNDIGFLDKPFLSMFEKFQNLAYSGIIIVDKLARTSTGWAAYVKRMDEIGLDPYDFTRVNKEALDYAQRITRLTNASSLWKDAPAAISRGTGVLNSRSWNRAFLKFMTFPLAQWSLLRNNAFRFGYGEYIRTGDKKALATANMIILMLMIAKSYEVLGRIEANRAEQMLVGKDPEVDTFWQGMLKEMSNTVPFVSHASSLMFYNSSPFPMSAGPSYLFGGLGKITRDIAGETEMKPETKAKAVADTLIGAGIFLGVPGMVQLRALVRNLIDANAENDSGGSSSSGQGLF